MRLARRLAAGAVLFGFVGMGIGCSAPPAYEPQQSSQSKLLAPKALFKAKASATTTKETGITEWRVFRGKKDFVLTGYGSKGQSIAGTAIRFAKEGGENVLSGRVLDGSHVSSSYVFGRRAANATVSSTASAKTQKVFRRALADMLGIRLALQQQGRGYVPQAQAPTGLDPANPGTGLDPAAGNGPLGGLDPRSQLGQLGQLGCGGDLLSMLTGALQCLGNGGGLANLSLSSGLQMLQCALASQGAATSAGTCQDPGGAGTEEPFDPTMGGQMDPFGQAGAQGEGEGESEGEGQGGPEDPQQVDPLAQGDPFGQQQCQSCQGEFDDFGIDANNGAVGFENEEGE